MNILYAASEVAPFMKTGGLADVAGSLPKALRNCGADVRVIMPLYEGISDFWRSQMTFCFHTYVDLSWRHQYCGLFMLEKDGVTYYFIDNEYYFKRTPIYGFFDEAERFAFFSRAIVDLLPNLGWKPNAVSCNDWQTALVSVYMRQELGEFFRDIKTVFTIHNIEYQGMYAPDILDEVLGLPSELYDSGIIRYENAINLMKGAIYTSDVLTTVSQSYANELRDPYFGSGLHKVIEENSFKLRGILNGIDKDVYNPQTDEKIYCAFSADDMSGKAINKSELQRELQLDADTAVPIIACVSRLVSHKGFDIVSEALDRLMQQDIQLVILGTGDYGFEQRFIDAANVYRGKLAVRIEYSDWMAAKIYAGADMLLMPSRSEPCGLSQIIAMRYGTVPIVREVGGLRDSVKPYPNEDSNGFTFNEYSVDALLGTVGYAVSVYKDEDKKLWESLRGRAISSDYGWERSAKEYMEMYRYIVDLN